ncbi:MAG: DUF4105 domain-containing protein [Gammaproteobacteria bacterium]|nr:DUF4105 domain-containing protein [Gammaproteobacteria bacterium]
MKTIKCLSAWLLFCLSWPLIADPAIIHLAEQPTWQRLLHQPSAQSASEIDDARFFLSESRSSFDELTATLQAFQTDPRTRCRFAARYEWLAQQLDWQQQRLTATDCPELMTWMEQLNTQQVSLIFPTAFMNSPSSMFGHLFLRLDSESTQNDLLAFSVNYGANVNNQDSSLTYMVKGLGGGYPGTYTVVPYYEKVKEYNDIEHRDIWEYPLPLNKSQIRRLMLHLWELKAIEIDYYFIDENCAYRILALIAVAFPEHDLLSEFQGRAIPADVLKATFKHGLTRAPEYRTSLATELTHAFAQLTSLEQQWVTQIIADQQELQTQAFLRLPEASRARVYETLNLWLRYQLSDAGSAVDESQLGYQLLLARSQISTSSDLKTAATPARPEDSHDAYRFGLGVLHQKQQNSLLLSGRVAYHDLLDNPSGYLAGAQIEFFNLTASIDNSARIEALTLLSLKSLAPRDELISPLSWSFAIGTKRHAFSPDNSELLHYLDGRVGQTFGNDNNLYYLLYGINFTQQSAQPDQPHSLAAVALGWLHQGAHAQWLAEYDWRRDVDGSQLEWQQFSFGYQYNLDKQSAWRFDYLRQALNRNYQHALQLNYYLYL